jgi:hypothetical protein
MQSKSGPKLQYVVLWLSIMLTHAHKQNTGNAMYCYQALCKNVDAFGPRVTCLRRRHAKAESESRRFKLGVSQLRERILE